MKHASTFPILESLEQRLAPAGIVAVSTAGGNLTLTGDAEGSDNVVSIVNSAGGGWRIFDPGASGTLFSLNGADPVATLDIQAPTKAVKIQLGEGDDTLSLSGLTVAGAFTVADKSGTSFINLTNNTLMGAVKIDTGDGFDELSFVNNTIAGKTTLKLGGGNDSLNLFGGFYRDITVDYGSGSNSLTTNDSALNIDGNLTLSASPIIGDSQNFILASDAGFISGSVKLTVKAGSSQFNLGSDLDSQFTIGGGLSLTTGAANDSIVLSGNINVGGAFTVKAGEGNNQITGVQLDTLSLGSMNYTGGKENDSVTLISSDMSIRKGITMNAGAGSTNSLQLFATNDMTVGGGIVFKASGDSANTLSIDANKAHILGTLTYTGGHISNDIDILPGFGSQLGGFTYKGGNGSDDIKMGDYFGSSNTLITITGKVNVNLGKGDNLFAIRDTTFHSSVTVASGTEADGENSEMDVFLVKESTFLNTLTQKSTSDAKTTVEIADSLFYKAVNVSTGAGNDAVRFDTPSGSTVNNVFHDKVKVLLGDGDDFFAAGSDVDTPFAVNFFNALLTVDGGKGFDGGYFLSGYNNTFNPEPKIIGIEEGLSL